MKRNFLSRLFRRSAVSYASTAPEPSADSAASDENAGTAHSSRPLKVWLMNHYAAEMYQNKAGRHYWFAKKLEQRGFSPTVFSASSFHNKPTGIDTGGKRFKVMYTDDTPFVFVRVTPSTGNGIARVRNMLQFFFGLFPTAKSYAATCGKPDVIIGSSVHPLTMVAALLIARRMKVPCICEIRDLWPEAIFTFGKTKPNSLLGRILTAGEHWIYRKADALIFTKEGDTDYIKEKRWDTDHGGDVDLAKCHYINNGVDIPAYDLSISTQTMRDSELDDPDAFNVVYAGIIRPVNNVGNLLDTAALLKGYPRIRFLIYGDGDQLPQLRQRVKDEHLTNVSLKGHVERRFIPYILSRSSVNILNYSQNQFNWTRGNSSNKLFEYLASGKPVISTVRMGYSIINRWKCGFETEQCTARSLADAILRIYSMPEEQYRQLGINARTAAMQFDFERLTDRLVSVIDSVTDDTASHTVSR